MSVSILENIHGHPDLINLTPQQRRILCDEIRQFLIAHVSKTGGHVASNLGVVELTVAIETVYDTAKDRLVFDVGHQSYIHKILTDRQAGFQTLRQYGGMAGFPKPSESVTDAFIAGHASSSVSVALGMARARTMQKQDYDVVALIGDGAATGGLAYEGLNDAAVSGEPMVVILNDNELSIDRNVGAMASHLRKLRTKERYLGMKQRYRKFLLKIPGGNTLYHISYKVKNWIRRVLIPTTIFDNMGFTYLGPVDGHDTEKLIDLLQDAKEMARPVLVHVVTQKGKGYPHSEEHPKLFHGIGEFDPVTGEPKPRNTKTFSDAFGDTMMELAMQDARICAITAAMPGGTGLLDFKYQYPQRLFDVGIAEEHAVSMAGGLAKQGMIPVVALYSTFLQRSYDMILQDICLQNLHVVFAVDRAGLVGEDGETHHGVFDVGFLRQAPGMQILCPGSVTELRDMLLWAARDQSSPVAIRYPRGGDQGYTGSAWREQNGCVCCHRKGKDVTIITYGTLLENAMEAAELLETHGIHASVLRLLSVQPLPVNEIKTLIKDSRYVLIAEETAANCGIGAQLSHKLLQFDPNLRVETIDLGERFVPHGNLKSLYSHCGLDAQSIAKKIMEVRPSEK